MLVCCFSETTARALNPGTSARLPSNALAAQIKESSATLKLSRGLGRLQTIFPLCRASKRFRPEALEGVAGATRELASLAKPVMEICHL